ncbi:MAG: stage III sporulation protein AF [Candidatus Carbobacillus altaicus]|nr:stage III sporulation protein AF [Candidatus Carbobacillus altaicus]
MIQLVTIVLLATIIEMLLPSTEMKRYTRFVLSLMIMLALIDPVLKIFSLEPLRDGALAEKTQALFANAVREEVRGGIYTDIHTIQENGEEMGKRLEQAAFDLARRNMEHVIQDAVFEATGEKSDVALIFKDQELERIEVYLLGQVHKKNNKDALHSSAITIAPIELTPVHVAVRDEETGRETEQDASLAQPVVGQSSGQADEARLRARVSALVQNKLSLDGVPVLVYRR